MKLLSETESRAGCAARLHAMGMKSRITRLVMLPSGGALIYRQQSIGIVNEANLIGGENVGGATNDAPASVAASDDDDDGGDGDSDPDRRKPRTRTRNAKQQTAPLACNGLPSDGYVRLPQVLAVFPVSKSSWWAGCKSGRYPIPVKLGPRTTAWRVSDIRALIEHPAI